MWKTTNYSGKEVIWYSQEEVKEMLAEIKEIALEACLCCGECQTEFSEKDYCDFKQILQKISEVENANNNP